MSDNSQNFDSLQERNQQVLNDISQLQGQERTLYTSLDDVNLMLYKKNILMSKRTIILKNLENGDLKKIIL